MVFVQVNIDEETDKMLRVYQARGCFTTKQDAINAILLEYLKQ